MSDLLPIVGSLGAFSAAIYLWKLSRVAALFRYAAVVVAVLVGFAVAGIITLEVHPERAVELGATVWGYLPLVAGVVA